MNSGPHFPSVATITLGPEGPGSHGNKMPGVWTLQPGQKEFGWAESQPMGMNGATLKPTGDPLAEFTFLVRFFSAADWEAFQPLRRRYLSKPVYNPGTGVSLALSIVHPELNLLGIKSVVPKKAPWFTNQGKGLWVGEVTFKQFRPPKLAKADPPRNEYSNETGSQPSPADLVESYTSSNNASVSYSRG